MSLNFIWVSNIVSEYINCIGSYTEHSDFSETNETLIISQLEILYVYK